MEVKLAREMGFCFGVRRAVNMVEKIAGGERPVAILGSLVHNPQVVASLEEQGVVTVSSVEDVDGGVLVIPSHGAAPRQVERARSRGLEVVDATCPFVRVAQKAAEKLNEDGFQTIIVGDRAHTEVKGIAGWTRGKARVISGPEELSEFALEDQVGVLAQTTQKLAVFEAVVNEIVSSSLSDLRELRVVNTICSATASRQAAAMELAGDVEVVIVVGGKASANTQRLLEISERAGKEAHLVESPDELQPDWIKGREKVGVTAGASTPDNVVRSVVQKIIALGSR